uniref:Uncharacterized protein n=1 Tax=Globodera rostochiensis TaxID=31243 RepID=A0A914H6C4_GLORO
MQRPKTPTSDQMTLRAQWHNKDLYNTAQELLDSVPNVNDRRQNVAAAPINVDFVKKWLHKYIDGFQDKIERLMKQFHLALYSFIESIKAKTSSSSTIFWAHRENGFNYQQHHSMAQQQRRRRRQRRGKSMKTFDGITQGGGGGVEAAANPLCILFLLLAMAALVGLIVGLGVPSLDHHAKLPVIIISVVVLVFNLVLLCAMCNLPE